jgi:hypothetical protein
MTLGLIKQGFLKRKANSVLYHKYNNSCSVLVASFTEIAEVLVRIHELALAGWPILLKLPIFIDDIALYALIHTLS